MHATHSSPCRLGNAEPNPQGQWHALDIRYAYMKRLREKTASTFVQSPAEHVEPDLSHPVIIPPGMPGRVWSAVNPVHADMLASRANERRGCIGTSHSPPQRGSVEC